MSVTRQEVVREAREWLGTPFHHQAREKGVGTDCGGLVGGVAVALGIVPPDWWRDTFDPRWGGYGRQPAQGTLQQSSSDFDVAIKGKGFFQITLPSLTETQTRSPLSPTP